MLLLRLLKNNFFKGSTTIWILTMMSLVIVNGRPQDPKIFEDLATKGLMMAGNMAEMIGNAGMLSKQMGFEMPFANGNSNTAIGTGAAFRNDDDDDSSEEDRRRRKKRSLNFLYNSENDNILKDWTQLHRDKRSPCHTGGTGSGGNGGDGGDGGDGDDLDIAERRRRAYARIMAARKRARNAKKTTRKTTTNTNRRRKQKYLINNDVNNDVEQTLSRRKRQTELEDLNENMTNASKDFQQQAQEIAEKVRNVFESFMNSINEMAQKLKENLSIKNSSNSEDI